MSAITIRRLDPKVIEGLKAKAKAAGRSMEEEARAILTREVSLAPLSGEAAAAYFEALRGRFPAPGDGPTTIDTLREIRDEDP